MAFPQARGVGALEQQLADEVGEVGGVGRGAGGGAQAADAGGDLPVPVGEQITGRGVQEEGADEVAVCGRPVVRARGEGEAAGGQASMSMLRLIT